MTKLMRRLTYLGVGLVVIGGVAMAGMTIMLSPPKRKPVVYRPAEAVMRRLSPDQYRNVIADVFGPSIELGGHFEPDLRVGGLLAVGASSISVSAAGMEQYDAMARAIASQVTGEKHRDTLIPCKPASPKEADDACAGKFLSKVGLLLYRRPLSKSEVATYAGAADLGAKATGSFYDGLSLSLAGMLSSPQFLFRQEVAEKDPNRSGLYRLDGYSTASQLSFFLWNSGPDPQLLAAAEKGELDTASGFRRQVDRMVASPRLEAGVRAFFSDMLAFDEFASLSKDTVLYPKFDALVADDAQEQTLKTIVDLLVTRQADYRDLFTSKRTFLNKRLASLYRVPLVDDQPNGSPGAWQAYEFPATDGRAGILTQISFTALHSPPVRGSPTIRGKALREIFLCQVVPPPPADVKFDVVQDTSNPQYKTARERLAAHRANPICAGCHKALDPMGLTLENFDGSGAYRTTENGVLIDTSGDLDGIAFTDATGLGHAMHENSALPACLVDRMSSYALGWTVTNSASWMKALRKAFAESGYRVPELMRQIALSEAFTSVRAPRPAQPISASAETTQIGKSP